MTRSFAPCAGLHLVYKYASLLAERRATKRGDLETWARWEMSDEDEAFDQDEDDEIEAEADDTADIDVDEVDDVVEDDDEESEAIAAKPVGRVARSESPEAHSIEARDKVRKSLAADVEAFLARGGSIQTIAEDRRTETPKKPDSSFGRRSV
jgi:hypothetical protein